jgi:DNA mismatch endonuclease (patch repair protein)
MNRASGNTKIVGRVSRYRSALMARIRGKGSKPEMVVRKEAHALGYRFRLHQRELPGRPDLTFPKLRKIIFVNGCFWHRHKGCLRATTPKTRAKFWRAKFAANVRRDRQVLSSLRRLGWKVLVVWECQTFEREPLTRRLDRFLGSK